MVICSSKREGTHSIQHWNYCYSKYELFLPPGLRILQYILVGVGEPCGHHQPIVCPTTLRFQIIILMQILAWEWVSQRVLGWVTNPGNGVLNEGEGKTLVELGT